MFNANKLSEYSSDQGFPDGQSTTKDDYVARNNFDAGREQADQIYQQAEREATEEEISAFPDWYSKEPEDETNINDTEDLAQSLKEPKENPEEEAETLSA